MSHQPLPWYKKHPEDWRRLTRKHAMSFELRGFLTECVDAMADNGGPIPSDEKALAMMLGTNARMVRALMPKLIDLGLVEVTPRGYWSAGLMRMIGRQSIGPPIAAGVPPSGDRVDDHSDADREPVKLEPNAKIQNSSMNSTREVESDAETDKEADSPPLGPRSPSLKRGGGESDNRIIDAGQNSTPPTGWASRWTPSAKRAVEALRVSDRDVDADIAELFIDAVRGARNPPSHVDALAYLRELVDRLGEFDRPTLAALAEHQLTNRTHTLDAVPKLVELARQGGLAQTAGADNDAAALISISPATDPNEAAAWIARKKRYAPKPSANQQIQKLWWIGSQLEAGSSVEVPSRMPPAEPSEVAA